jgi:phosphoglycolate phosphatase-like HAD superfamily hydrolase
MRDAAVGPPDTLLVGDSQVDLRTARAAGVRFCLAGYGFGVEQLPDGLVTAEDWVIDHPGDLLVRLAEG